MTKPVWSHVLALSGWTLKGSSNNQLPKNLSPDYKYLNASQIPHNKAFPHTIPDCIRYIIGIFCNNFKSKTNIFAPY